MPTISLYELGKDLLEVLDPKPSRAGLAQTPARWSRAMQELTTPEEFEFTTFEEPGADEMIIVAGIPFYSLCEHHILPMWGSVAIGYIPNAKGRIAGLSKLPRTVRFYSRRLQVQERLTRQVADHIQKHLDPAGVGVVVHARHLCMEMRGAEVGGTGCYTQTSALIGIFREEPSVRNEFLSLIPTPRQ